MTTRGERNVGPSLAAAGVGVIGVAVVFGLTTDSGGPDWIGIITLAAGALMAITGPVHGLPEPPAPHRLSGQSDRRTRRDVLLDPFF